MASKSTLQNTRYWALFKLKAYIYNHERIAKTVLRLAPLVPFSLGIILVYLANLEPGPETRKLAFITLQYLAVTGGVLVACTIFTTIYQAFFLLGTIYIRDLVPLLLRKFGYDPETILDKPVITALQDDSLKYFKSPENQQYLFGNELIENTIGDHAAKFSTLELAKYCGSNEIRGFMQAYRLYFETVFKALRNDAQFRQTSTELTNVNTGPALLDDVIKRILQFLDVTDLKVLSAAERKKHLNRSKFLESPRYYTDRPPLKKVHEFFSTDDKVPPLLKAYNIFIEYNGAKTLPPQSSFNNSLSKRNTARIR
jgi:hypothetical protein